MQSINSMIGFGIKAADGNLGNVKDFYFDDETWTIRYMVVDTGKWLSGRKVLISLASVGEPDWKSLKLPVTLTREQVRHSPDIDTEKPVYRQHETKLHQHYQLPLYWQGNYGGGYPGNLGVTFGIVPSPIFFGGEESDNMESCPPEQNNDPHLRSMRHITGHDVCGTDGKIGHLEDFIVEKGTWIIRYIVVNTRIWLQDREVLVSPQWIRKVDWNDSCILVDIAREDFRKSPVYDRSKTITPSYEKKLLKHLNKPEPSKSVTFRFHAAPGAEIHVAGTFNNWDKSKIRLRWMNNNLYAASMLLPQGRYEYRFIVDGKWCNGGCKEQIPNPFGTMNNVLVVSPQKNNETPEGLADTFSRFHDNEKDVFWNSPI